MDVKIKMEFKIKGAFHGDIGPNDNLEDIIEEQILEMGFFDFMIQAHGGEYNILDVEPLLKDDFVWGEKDMWYFGQGEDV